MKVQTSTDGIVEIDVHVQHIRFVRMLQFYCPSLKVEATRNGRRYNIALTHFRFDEIEIERLNRPERKSA
jgi:hypothetical protein